MHISELFGKIDDILLLDLVSGMQVCTEIKSLDDMNGSATTGKLMVFQISVEPQNPQLPPSDVNPMVQKVSTNPYGGPFTIPKAENTLYAADIVMVHVPIAAVEKAYLQAISGIEIAGAGALGGPSGLVR